jgi:hypothetical protein
LSIYGIPERLSSGITIRPTKRRYENAIYDGDDSTGLPT